VDVTLVRVTPEGVKGELTLTRERTVMGRGEGADVRVPVSKISRSHCAFVVTPEGDIAVEDLGSSNGTWVNQERIERQPLAAGDLVCLGGMVFVVRVNGDPEELEPGLLYEDGLPDEEGEVESHSPSSGGAGREPLVPAVDPDDSSIADFEFDLGDEEDGQPPL